MKCDTCGQELNDSGVCTNCRRDQTRIIDGLQYDSKDGATRRRANMLRRWYQKD